MVVHWAQGQEAVADLLFSAIRDMSSDTFMATSPNRNYLVEAIKIVDVGK
jgi:hypothetical protein